MYSIFTPKVSSSIEKLIKKNTIGIKIRIIKLNLLIILDIINILYWRYDKRHSPAVSFRLQEPIGR